MEDFEMQINGKKIEPFEGVENPPAETNYGVSLQNANVEQADLMRRLLQSLFNTIRREEPRWERIKVQLQNYGGGVINLVAFEDKENKMPTSCVCGRVVTMGSVRWNGERWEHTTDPIVGHHSMTEKEAYVSPDLRQPKLVRVYAKYFSWDMDEVKEIVVDLTKLVSGVNLFTQENAEECERIAKEIGVWYDSWNGSWHVSKLDHDLKQNVSLTLDNLHDGDTIVVFPPIGAGG